MWHHIEKAISLHQPKSRGDMEDKTYFLLDGAMLNGIKEFLPQPPKPYSWMRQIVRDEDPGGLYGPVLIDAQAADSLGELEIAHGLCRANFTRLHLSYIFTPLGIEELVAHFRQFIMVWLEDQTTLIGQKIFAAQIKTRGVGGGYHSKAQEIYEEIKSTEPSWFMNKFFDGYVHDSYAGFIGQFEDGVFQLAGAAAHILAEPRRYLSYRYMYSGDDTRLNVMANQNQRLA